MIRRIYVNSGAACDHCGGDWRMFVCPAWPTCGICHQCLGGVCVPEKTEKGAAGVRYVAPRLLTAVSA